MDKGALRQQVLDRLADDLRQAEQALRVAHETATHQDASRYAVLKKLQKRPSAI